MNPNTEETILQAAEREFLAKGYAQTRTTDIAAAAGVTHAMLHYYFRTKENLFNRIFEQKAALMSELLTPMLSDESLEVEEKIRRCVEAHFDFLYRHPGLPLFILHEISTNPAHKDLLFNTVYKYIGNSFHLLQQKLDTLYEQGRIAQIDVRNLVFTIVALNVTTFMAIPLVRNLYDDLGDEQLYEMRKRENIETILRRLKP